MSILPHTSYPHTHTHTQEYKDFGEESEGSESEGEGQAMPTGDETYRDQDKVDLQVGSW